MVQHVKIKAKIESPTMQTGYAVTYSNHESTTSNPNSNIYADAEKWIAEGNTPEPAFTQAQLDSHTIEANYETLVKAIDTLQVEYMEHIFSGSTEAQAYIVAMLTKIEGENPNSTRNVFAIDGRTRVPMTKTQLSGLMNVIDVAQEAITGD